MWSLKNSCKVIVIWETVSLEIFWSSILLLFVLINEGSSAIIFIVIYQTPRFYSGFLVYFSGLYFPKCGKILTRKTPNRDTFHAVFFLHVLRTDSFW